MIRPRSPIVSWFVAVLAVGITLAVSYGLREWLGVTTPTLFVIPVALAAWMGGLGPGIFATVLSGLMFTYYITDPVGSFALTTSDVVRLASLMFVAVAVNWLEASRRRLETQVEHSRDELDHILQESGDGITVLGPDGKLIYANPEGARLVGFKTPDEMLKAPITEIMSRFEIVDEQNNPVSISDLPSRRAMAGETPEPVMMRFRVKATGEERWSLVRARPVRNADKSMRFIVNNFQDITAIKAAEAAARAERERLLVTIASIGDAVIATDAAGKITFMNRVAERLTGWTSAAAVGQPLPVVFDIINEVTREVIENPVEVALRENRIVELANSTVLRSRSGIEIPIEDSAAPICDENDIVSGVVLVFRDVTEKKRREAVRRFILDVSKAFDDSLELDLTIQNIAEMLVPSISDWCTIDLVGDDGRLYEAALVHADLAKQRRVHDMRMGSFEADPQIGLVVQIAKSGESVLISDYSAERLRSVGWGEEQIAVFNTIGLTSTIVVPLKVHDAISGQDQIIGVLSLSQAQSGRQWTQDDVPLVEQIADRAAVAIQNARLYREMRAERERLRVTLSSIGDAVIATDTQGRVVFMNEVAQRLTAWTQAEAFGKPLKDVFVIVNEDTRATVESPVTKVLREGKIVGLANHTILIARDGTEIPIDDSGAPIRDGSDEMMGVILVFRDISERKATEAQIAALGEIAETERKRLDEIVRNIPGVVWESWGEPDAKTQRINYVSEYVEEMLGYTREEWLNTPNFWYTIVHPDDQEGAAARARATYESREAGTNQFRWLTKDGRAIWVEAHSRTVVDENGTPLGMRGVTFDISERKRDEGLVLEQNEVIATINRMGQALSAELDLETLLQNLTDAATEITGAQFGSFFYNVVNAEGESYMLYTLSGVPREKFSSFPMPRNTKIFAPTFAGDGVVRSDDITKDPRYGQNAPYHGKPEGHLPVVSYLAIPVIGRSGEVIGGLFFGHEKAGVFTEREEQIVVGLAAQAAIAVDNARLFREASDQREQLRASEQQLRVITDSLPVLISYIDSSLRYQFNNLAYEQWFGQSREEIRGKTMPEVLGDDATNSLRPHFEKALNGETALFEALVPYRAGSRYVSGSYVPDFDPDGAVRGFFVLISDVSDRRVMENALRESEGRFRTVANAAPVMIWVTDDHNLCTYLNKQWLDFTGQTLEEGMGMGWLDAVHPEDSQQAGETFLAAAQRREPFVLEYRLRRADGEYRWALDTGTPLLDEAGGWAGYIGSVIDIEERRAMENALRESETRFRTIFEQAAVGIAQATVEGNWLGFNRRAHEMLGYTYDEFMALGSFRAITHPADHVGDTAQMQRVLNGEIESYQREKRYIHKNGSVVWVLVTITLVRDPADGNKPLYWIGIIEDISARRKAEVEQEFLADVTEALSASLDHDETLAQVASLAVPRIADWCAIDLITDEDVILRKAVAHVDPDKIELFWRLWDLAKPHIDEPGGTGKVIRTGEPDLFFDIPPALIDQFYEEPIRGMLHSLGLKSSIVLPLMIDGKAIGSLTMAMAESGRRFNEDDVDFAQELARRAAGAIDRARLFRDASEQRERLRVTLASIGDAVIATDGQGRVTFINPVAERLTGWASEDAVGERIEVVFHIVNEDTGEIADNPVNRVLATGQIIGLANHTVLISRDGERIPIDDSGAPIRTANNVVVGVILVFRDIRERKEVEMQRDAYARQQAVIATLGQQALMGLDIQQLMDEATRAMATTLRLDSVKVLELLPNGEDLLLRAGVGWKPGLVGKRTVSAGTGSHAGFTLLAKSPVVMDDLRYETRFAEPLLNEHQVVSGMSVLIEGRDGQPWGVLGAHTRTKRTFSQDDIHFLQAVANVLAEALQRKQAREDLERSLDRTRDLYEISRRIGSLNSPQQILEALVTSRALTNVQRAIITMFSTAWHDEIPESAELVAEWQPEQKIQPLRGQRYSLATYDLARVVQRGEPVIIGNVETDSRLSEASRKFSLDMGIRSYIVFPLIASNQWFGLLSLQWDQPYVAGEEDARHLQGLVDQAASAIYNLSLLEAEARARRSAEKADALKMQFLAMISHELRTPLTSIKGFTTTLLSEDVEWDAINQREFLSIINEESDNLTDLIEQLLDLSRLEAGTLTIQKRVLPLNEIFTQAMPQLFMIASKHHLEVDLPTDLPQVDADGRRISQVISNVVANAAKYSPEGTLIRITADVSADQVQINVTDQGHGIPIADQEAVFEAFRQAENRPKEETKGAGLGLAISRGLIEAHGGTIWISASGREGTTVSFTLPTA